MKITRRQLRQLISEQVAQAGPPRTAGGLRRQARAEAAAARILTEPLAMKAGKAIDDLGDELAGVNLMGLDARGHDSLVKWLASKLGLENYWTFLEQINLDVYEWIAEYLAPEIVKTFIDNQMNGSDLLKVSATIKEMNRVDQFQGIFDRVVAEFGPDDFGIEGRLRLAAEIASAIATRVRYM